MPDPGVVRQSIAGDPFFYHANYHQSPSSRIRQHSSKIGKALRKAVDRVFGAQAVVQRCMWHKRENVVRYLATHGQATYRRKLQAA